MTVKELIALLQALYDQEAPVYTWNSEWGEPRTTIDIASQPEVRGYFGVKYPAGYVLL